MGFGNECYKGQRYDKLKKDLLKAGELFRDPEFPASQKSIFYSKTDPEIEWKRPTEICKLPKLVVEGGNCDDLQEGELGNRWFISACSSIANFKPLFDKVIPDVSTQTFSSSYAGIFKFDFWYFGSWVEVVVDDFLPTKHGRLIFCHSTTKNEFWSALLEKAYAKLLGDYESLSAGLAVDALIDFTGGVSEWIKSAPKGDQDETNLFNHLKESLENKALVIAEIMDGGDVGETLPTAPEPEFEVDADVLLVAEIDQTPDTTAAVPSTTASISTPTKPKTTSTVRPTTSLIDRDGFVTDCGLYRCHGYNVRQIRTVALEGRSLNMVRLQSPWQGGEWIGDFSNVSPEMKILKPQEKEKLGLKFELESEFWMPFSDFCEQFNSFQICHFVNTSIFSIKKKYSESLLPGRWISSITSLDNRAGGAKHTNFTQNPQYLFEMSKPETIMCSLEQNDRTVERMQDRNLTNEEIALGVYKMEGAIESCGNNSQSSSQKRRSFTNKQKAQAVKRSEVIGVNGAAKEFSIDRRLMQRWRAMPSDDARVSRRAKTTRRGKFEKMEEELGVWFTDCRTLSKCVRTKDINRKAIELHKKFDYAEPFTASNGWLEGFKTRYNIASRKITGHSQKIPTSFPTLATAFWAEFRYIVQQSDVKPPNIINMDETPCYFDMGGGSTFSTKGERDILQRTTGHDKTRFTCCLSVTGSGRALPTMLIFKNLVKVPQLPAGKTWPKDIVVTVAKGGSMTSELFQYYLDNIVSRRPGAIFGSKCVVVVDSATSHKGQPKDHNIEIIKIPKGCTPPLQPLDVYVNKPFKSLLGEKWQKWIDQPEAVHELTRGGNRKRASYLDIASWVSSAVRELDPHMIENSFVGCGLVGHDGGDQWSNVVNRARLHTRIKPYLEEPSEEGLVDSSDDEEVVNDEDDGLLESDVEIVEPVVDVESKYAVNTLVTSDEQVLFDLDDDLSTVEITIKEVEDNRKYRIHSNKSTTIVASSGDPAKQRSVFTAQRLDQGRYIIIPATGRPNIEANFLLRFYSDVGSTAKEIDKHNPGKAGMCSSPPTMVVQIGIVRCDGLSVEKGDVNAFCTLKCDGQTVKTPVIKSNKDPEWNRLYIFYRKAGDKENPINIQVSNSGSISNTLIGEASISEFKPSHEKVTTQLIVKSKKKDQPDVQLGSTVEYRIYSTEDLNEL